MENFIGCAICLNISGNRIPADAIIGGYSVCTEHVLLASNENFEIHRLTGKKGTAT